MKKIRIGNDFTITRTIVRGDSPEDLVNISNPKLELISYFAVPTVNPPYTISDVNKIDVNIETQYVPKVGKYKLVFSYDVPEAGFVDDFRKVTIDIAQFEIVSESSKADDCNDVAAAGQIEIGIKGDSAFRVWLGEAGNSGKTKQDYFDWLQEPATEAVDAANTAAQEANTATGLAIAAKNDYYNVVKPEIIAQGEYATAQGDYAKQQGLQVKNKVDNLEVSVADNSLKVTSVVKTYQTEAEALADKNPIDITTSLPLTVGQFISIVDDGEKNGIYRIGSISGDGTMSLELQGKLGDLSEYLKSNDDGTIKKGLETVDVKTATDKIRDRDSGIKLSDSLYYIQTSENLFTFTDNEGAVLGRINNRGEWEIKLSPDHPMIENRDIEGLIFAITDSENKVLFGIDDYGEVISNNNNRDETAVIEDTIKYPYDSEKGELELHKSILIAGECVFNTTAKGRRSEVGGIDDRPEVPLTTSGICHPKILYIPSGWNGYRYWAVMTPTFGIIGSQPNPPQFENPHILCSNDGVNFIEPEGIVNPLDEPAPKNSSWWSDGHIELGDDGYMHLFYRGCWLGNDYFGDGLNHTTAIVHRKSKFGWDWTEKKLMYSNENENVDQLSALVSQAFINNGSYWHVYEGVRSSTNNPIPPQKNQTETFVQRRIDRDADGNYGEFEIANTVNFRNRPWGEDSDIWHLDAFKFGNTWFLLLNTGPIGGSGANSLYLAYSGDGWNFTVLEEAIHIGNCYRSSMIPISATKENIVMRLYRNGTARGNIELSEITLKYK